MTDTYPPFNLSPEATPWARMIQRKLNELDSLLGSLKTNLGNLGDIQSIQLTRLVQQAEQAQRDVQAVNAELFKANVVIKQQGVKIVEQQAELSSQAGSILYLAGIATSHSGLITSLQTQNAAQQAELSSQAGSINYLAGIATGHGNSISTLQNQVSTLQGQVSGLQGQIDGAGGSIGSLASRVDAHEDSIRVLRLRVTALENNGGGGGGIDPGA